MRVFVNTFLNPEDARTFVNEFFYEAWKASTVVGLGILQDRGPDLTPEDIIRNVFNHSDYSPALELQSYAGSIYADYVFGRMMKVGLNVNLDDCKVLVNDIDCSPDYQSWSRVYETVDQLINEVHEKMGHVGVTSLDKYDP